MERDMEGRTTEAPENESSVKRSAPDPARRESLKNRPRVDEREPVNERTPEEAGYGYGV
jgi:hypothetical protein